MDNCAFTIVAKNYIGLALILEKSIRKSYNNLDFYIVVADELEKAAETSTNEEFNKYLKLQAIALCENNPKNDAYADKKWAELQDTPLEFTISREQYADELTGTVVENEELKKLLEENNIEPISKDSIGIRVGIVNKEGTKRYTVIEGNNIPYDDPDELIEEKKAKRIEKKSAKTKRKSKTDNIVDSEFEDNKNEISKIE